MDRYYMLYQILHFQNTGSEELSKVDFQPDEVSALEFFDGRIPQLESVAHLYPELEELWEEGILSIPRYTPMSSFRYGLNLAEPSLL